MLDRIKPRSVFFHAENAGILLSRPEVSTETRYEAASGDGAVPSLAFVGYNGGTLRIAGAYWPVVIDLATTKAAASVVMLWAHDPEVAVGHVEGDLKITTRKVSGRAKLSGSNERVDEIKTAGANGMPWQTSLGWESGRQEFVDSQSKVTVNGQTFQGPIYVSRDNTIREVSVLPLGADAGTSVTFSASYLGGPAMFEEWCTKRGLDPAKLSDEQRVLWRASFDLEQKSKEPPTPPPGPPTPPITPPQDYAAGFAAERERVDSISLLASEYTGPNGTPLTIEVGGRKVSLAAHAIRERWSTDRATVEFMKAGRPRVPSGRSDEEDADTRMRVICAAFTQSCHRGLSTANMDADERRAVPRVEDRGFTEKELDLAHKRFKSRMGPQELLYEAAVANGYTGGRNVKANLREMLRYGFMTASAFSTFDLPTFLTTNFNTFMMAGYNSVDPTWRSISAIGRVSDFKEIKNLRMTGSMNFEKVAPDGHIPHGDLGEQNYGNKADTYGKMLAVTRQDWYNDNLGAFVGIPRALGRGGALGLVRAFWTEFMDNSAFFVAGNNNVSSGALGVAGISALNTVFGALKDPQGEFVNSRMKYLLAPLGLYPTAKQIYTSGTLAGAPATLAPIDNPWAGEFIPLTTPYLTDPTITGNSTTAYYGLADPQDVPTIEVVFLDGIETPTVESADVDFSQLGVQWRGYFDWGVRKQDPNGGVRSTGV